MNRYSVYFKYSVFSDSHLNFETKGKIKFITVTQASLACHGQTVAFIGPIHKENKVS